MTMRRPCLVCGEPSTGPRCAEHTLDDKPTAHTRGYDAAWTRLSKRARRLQPFCTDCGSTEDLQTDHSIMAWHRVAIGLPVRLQDVEVRCGPCNRARGAARGPSATRGDAPATANQDPGGRRGGRYIPGGIG